MQFYNYITEREMKPVSTLKTFLDDERGATAIEYALMSSLIAIAILSALTNLGTRLSSEFSEISGALK